MNGEGKQTWAFKRRTTGINSNIKNAESIIELTLRGEGSEDEDPEREGWTGAAPSGAFPGTSAISLVVLQYPFYFLYRIHCSGMNLLASMLDLKLRKPFFTDSQVELLLEDGSTCISWELSASYKDSGVSLLFSLEPVSIALYFLLVPSWKLLCFASSFRNFEGVTSPPSIRRDDTVFSWESLSKSAKPLSSQMQYGSC
nr:hypothetical protein Iba_chr04fCG0990 [Ipomoea batatas]